MLGLRTRQYKTGSSEQQLEGQLQVGCVPTVWSCSGNARCDQQARHGYAVGHEERVESARSGSNKSGSLCGVSVQ